MSTRLAAKRALTAMRQWTLRHSDNDDENDDVDDVDGNGDVVGVVGKKKNEKVVEKVVEKDKKNGNGKRFKGKLKQLKQQVATGAKKKHGIDQSLRTAVWNRHMGEHIGRALCPVCAEQVITQRNFHCGHIVAEAVGGATHVDNLMPICAQCNLSMGTQHM